MSADQVHGAGADGARRDSADRGSGAAGTRRPPERKQVLLRLDPAIHEALVRWANDDLRSVNAQIQVILRDALHRAGRAPKDVGDLPRRGRPPGS